MLHKRSMIIDFLAVTTPGSLLDVGCGDHYVLSTLKLPNEYIGLDISDVVIGENTRRFPDKIFKCVDFAEVAELEGFRCDVVLCLEVLIHQHQKQCYDKLINNLIRATRKGGLVSGYIYDPRPEVQSEMIAWHEPIVDTLHRFGAGKVSVLGRSLETRSLAFVHFSV